jgi:peptide/nickel transport system permease protein
MTEVTSAAAPVEEYVASPPPIETESETAVARLAKKKPLRLYIAIGWLAMIVVSAVTADLLPLSPRDADACIPSCVRVPPFSTWNEVLGTDSLGRSVLTRLIYGARVSLVAGLASVTIALAIGLLVGMTMGYFRGHFDMIAGVLLDSLLSFPGIIVLIALAATLQPSLETVIIGLSIISFPQFARLARGATFQYASSEFVMASRGLGAKRRTILFREILPSVLASLLAYAGTILALLMLAEASLSFLGLSVVAPTPSWGNMIASGKNFLQRYPALVFVPSTVLFFTIYSLNVVGDWIRGRRDLAAKI